MEEIDTKHSDEETRYITISRVDDILFVVYTERGEVTRLISARRATKKGKDEILMSIVRVLIREPSPPTETEIKNFREVALKELAELNDWSDEVFCDEDCPELTDEELARLMPVHTRQNKLRLVAQ